MCEAELKVAEVQGAEAEVREKAKLVVVTGWANEKLDDESETEGGKARLPKD